jgi:hypothetical protein
MAMITVRDVWFSDDAGTLRLDTPAGWQGGAVGITGASGSTSAINLFAVAEGALFSDMPDTLPVELTSRSPNHAGGSATLTPLHLTLSKTLDLLGLRALYSLTKAWSDLPFKEVDSRREVATVMRQDIGTPATAADRFRATLHHTGRGAARQPSFAKNPDGTFSLPGDPAPKKEVPPAEFVTLGGGVEVLEARVPPAADRVVTAGAARALVRSPADIWFYSGHGLPSGELAVGPLDGTHDYFVWKEAADFLDAWVKSGNTSRTVDMRMLIINGCNVLNLDSSNGEPGKEWAKLMQARGGNLTHILGYAAKAPLDIGGGADIAARIGEAIRKGDDPVKAWLDVNAAHKRWGAVAMDAKGYHAFNDKHKPVTTPLP